MSSYSRNIDDNFNFSEEHKSINENLCNIEAQNSETSSSQFEEPNNSAICSDQVQIFEPLSVTLKYNVIAEWDMTPADQWWCGKDRAEAIGLWATSDRGTLVLFKNNIRNQL